MIQNKFDSTVDFKVKALQKEGTFSAYGNVFDVKDNAGEITVKGCFLKSLERHEDKGTTPRLLAQHGHKQMPIGVITLIKEDDYGLYFEGEFCLDTQAGREAYALVKMGAIDQFSVGYRTLNKSNDHARQAVLLLELDVKEISLVTFACNEESRIQQVKSAIDAGEAPTSRMVQKALQESGFSKRQAETAVNAIKSTTHVDESETEMTVLELFKQKADNHKLDYSGMELKVKGDVSLRDHVSSICTTVREKVQSMDGVEYAYCEDVYMDYVIVCMCGDDEKGDYREWYGKVPYTAVDGQILVGEPISVKRVVEWLTEPELEALAEAKKSEVIGDVNSGDALTPETKHDDDEVTPETGEQDVKSEEGSSEADEDVPAEQSEEELVDELKSEDFSSWFSK